MCGRLKLLFFDFRGTSATIDRDVGSIIIILFLGSTKTTATPAVERSERVEAHCEFGLSCDRIYFFYVILFMVD